MVLMFVNLYSYIHMVHSLFLYGSFVYHGFFSPLVMMMGAMWRKRRWLPLIWMMSVLFGHYFYYSFFYSSFCVFSFCFFASICIRMSDFRCCVCVCYFIESREEITVFCCLLFVCTNNNPKYFVMVTISEGTFLDFVSRYIYPVKPTKEFIDFLLSIYTTRIYSMNK